jgi:hypothetical protein
VKALSRIVPAAAAADGSLKSLGSVTVPGGAGGEGIAAA